MSFIKLLYFNVPIYRACDSIYVLAPLFNYVRVLYKHRHQDSLESINALLGCAIVLPSFFEDDNYVSVFENFEAEQQKDILSIYFHTVNWMRVSISAFASQRDPPTRRRVLSRLGELIRIEQRMKPLLARAPVDFVAPPYQFLTNVKLSNQNQKRPGPKPAAKLNATLPEPDLTGNQPSIADFTIKVGQCKTVKTRTDFEQMYGPRERYRPMEVEIIMLLVEQKFVLNHQLEEEQMGSFLVFWSYDSCWKTWFKNLKQQSFDIMIVLMRTALGRIWPNRRILFAIYFHAYTR